MKELTCEQNTGRGNDGEERQKIKCESHEGLPGGFILGLKTGFADGVTAGLDASAGLDAGWASCAAFAFWNSSRIFFLSLISSSVISVMSYLYSWLSYDLFSLPGVIVIHSDYTTVVI